MISIIIYLSLSYLIGLIIFFVELNKAIKYNNFYYMNIGIVVLLLSPLMAWHGLLHYLQAYINRYANTNYKINIKPII